MKQQSVQALLAATLVAGAIGCETTLSGGAATPAIGRTECPSDEFAIAVVDTVHTPRGDVTHTRTITTIPLAGPISNVPEFHDCQQLIQKENGYLALHAIFASFQLNLLADSLDTLAYTTKKRAFPAAEIYSSDTHGYAPLAIQHYFNCLYFYRDGSQWRANIVPIGKDETDCSKPLINPARAGTELKVLPVSPQSNDAAYPPVARWDWDPAHHEQYIGIKCGVAWCEVGSQQFAPAPALTAGPSFDPSPASPRPPGAITCTRSRAGTTSSNSPCPLGPASRRARHTESSFRTPSSISSIKRQTFTQPPASPGCTSRPQSSPAPAPIRVSCTWVVATIRSTSAMAQRRSAACHRRHPLAQRRRTASGGRRSHPRGAFGRSGGGTMRRTGASRSDCTLV